MNICHESRAYVDTVTIVIVLFFYYISCVITHVNFGVAVSHSFGYGLMDATAMVQLAKKWQTVPEQHKCEMLAPHKNRFVIYYYSNYLIKNFELNYRHLKIFS